MVNMTLKVLLNCNFRLNQCFSGITSVRCQPWSSLYDCSEYRSVKRHNVNLHMKKVHRMGSYDDLIVDGTFDYSHYGMTAEQLKIENYFVD